MTEQDTRFNLILPGDTHTRLKKKCADERTTMSEKVRELVDAYLSETPKAVVNEAAFKGIRTSTADLSVISDAVGLTELLKKKGGKDYV